MIVGIVGAGPAGSTLARELGDRAILFDPSHPRDKPCGGGLTPKVYKRIDIPDKLVESKMDELIIENSSKSVRVKIPSVLSVSRRDFDYWLLNEAVSSGAEYISERVVEFYRISNGWLVKTSKDEYKVDFLVGADGAPSLVRHKLVGPHQKMALAMETTLPNGSSNTPGNVMRLVFFRDLYGYVWSFPKKDYVNVGIGAMEGSLDSDKMKSRLFDLFPDADRDVKPWSLPFSLGRAGYPDFALIGDAAGHVNPITGEGISYAIRDGINLARAIKEGEPSRYETYWRKDFGSELVSSLKWSSKVYRSIHTLMSNKRFVEKAVRLLLDGGRITTFKLLWYYFL